MRNYALSLLIALSLSACSSKETQQPLASPAASEASAAPTTSSYNETAAQPQAKPKKKKAFDQHDYEK